MQETQSKPRGRPKLDRFGDSELNKAEEKFEQFEQEVKSLTHDRMSATQKQEVEPQTKMSQTEIERSKEIYLKPKRTLSSREPFNETYREDYNFAKEYVQFIAENKEIIGETIDLWTKPFAGMPAEEWDVPVNKPVWGPRYLAEQIKRCSYHRLTMQDKAITGVDGMGTYYGNMVVDSTIQRLDAIPVSTRKSLFFGKVA
jgi:hypothetical protein